MFKFFYAQNECKHENILPNVEAGYCPDCGEYVENHWYLTRCGCCGIKHKTIVIKDKISACSKYCKNCGSNKFIVEKLKKINFVNIHYAVVLKKIIKNKNPYFVQSWVEEEEALKLIEKVKSEA